MKTSLFDLHVRMVEGLILWVYPIKSFYTQTLDTDEWHAIAQGP
jgi:hypothetical protein